MNELFASSVSPVELVVRGPVVHLLLFAVFCIVLERDIGSVGIADVLFVVLVAAASQNATAGEYKTIGDGTVLIATLVMWNVAIDRLAWPIRSSAGFSSRKRCCWSATARC